MADTKAKSPDFHPSLVVGAWADNLVSGRRVAVVGDATTGLAEQIASTASRRVHAYDPDAERVARAIARRATNKVSTAPLDEALDMRGGAFDVVVVPDAMLTGDTAGLIDSAAALLSPRGTLVLASPNPEAGLDGVGYYELYDIVSAQFECVRVLGQAPFAGYSIAEFAAEGEPTVTIDTSLAGAATEPIGFMIVASQHELDVDPYTLLQTPCAPASTEADQQQAQQARQAQQAQQYDLAQAELDKIRHREERAIKLADERQATATKLRARVSELQAKTESLQAAAHDSDKLRRQLQRATSDLEHERRDNERARADIEESHQLDLDRMLDRIAELELTIEAEEEASKTRDQPADDAGEPDREASAQAARGFAFQIDELRKSLASARAECDDLTKRAARADELQQDLDDAQARVSELTDDADDSVAEAAAKEVEALEARVKERGQVVAQLQSDLRAGERLGRELLGRLQAAEKRLANGASQQEAAIDAASRDTLVAALQHKCSRYEADLQAATWKIAALEGKLEAPDDGSDHDKLEAALSAAREEVAVLKREIQQHSES